MAKSGPNSGPGPSKTGGFSFVAEPALLFHMLTSIMVFMVVQDYMAEQACLVNLGYSDKVCTALKQRVDIEKYETEEKEVQKYIGTVMMWRQILENVFPMFLVLLIGAWSDRYGRKLVMLIVLLGFIAQNAVLVLCVLFRSFLGSWTVALVSSLIPGIVGNQACFSMAVFSYISDTTSVEKRTFRTGLAHTMFFAGLTLGLVSGAVLAKSTLTYTQMFGMGLVMESLVFIYVYFAVKTVRDEDAVKGKTAADMVEDLFNVQHIKDAVSAVTKKRSGDDRKTLFLLLLAHATLMAPMMGEMGVMYLFSRIKFNWDSGDLGAFMTYKMVVGFLGNFVSMGFLTQYLKLTDPAVGIAAAGSMLLSSLFFSVASTNFMMYLCPIVAILASASMIVPRSIISKIVPATEIGKVNSFLASLDSIVPLLSAPLYTMFYKSTFEVFPGAFFLLSASLSTVPILIFWRILSSGQFAEKKKN